MDDYHSKYSQVFQQIDQGRLPLRGSKGGRPITLLQEVVGLGMVQLGVVGHRMSQLVARLPPLGHVGQIPQTLVMPHANAVPMAVLLRSPLSLQSSRAL